MSHGSARQETAIKKYKQIKKNFNIAIRIKYKIKKFSQETCESPIQEHGFKWEGRTHLPPSKLERML